MQLRLAPLSTLTALWPACSLPWQVSLARTVQPAAGADCGAGWHRGWVPPGAGSSAAHESHYGRAQLGRRGRVRSGFAGGQPLPVGQTWGASACFIPPCSCTTSCCWRWMPSGWTLAGWLRWGTLIWQPAHAVSCASCSGVGALWHGNASGHACPAPRRSRDLDPLLCGPRRSFCESWRARGRGCMCRWPPRSRWGSAGAAWQRWSEAAAATLLCAPGVLSLAVPPPTCKVLTGLAPPVGPTMMPRAA